jgi:MFS family permease
MCEDESSTEESAPVAGLRGGLAACRHRNYRLYLCGQIVSSIGTWMQSTAQSWLVYELSHSAWMLGIVNTVQFLPVLLFSLFSGVIVDRYPKRIILFITQGVAFILAAVLGVLIITGRVEVWHIIVLALFLGSISSLEMPARQAFLKEMVGKDDLLNAVAINSAILSSARTV